MSRRRSGRWPRPVMAAGALAGAAGVAAAGLAWTQLADGYPAVPRRVTALLPTTTSSPPSAGGQRYDAGVVDLCAVVDVTPLANRGFVVREAVPLTFSASSSCRMVLRLADAPSLTPDGDIDTSWELIAIVVDANSLVQRHSAGDRCGGCRPGGCDRLVWAHDQLECLDEDRDWYGPRLLRIRAVIRQAEAGRALFVRPAAVRWARGRGSAG